jgi:hypothetical protein
VSTAVFVFASLLGGAAVASPFAYIAGRRSSREELAGAHRLIEAMNAAPDRDALALPPERTGEQPAVELFDQDAEDLADIVLVASRMATDTGERHSLDEVMAKHGITQADLDAVPDDPPTWSGASHLQADPADDTGTGTIAHLSGEWAPAAPAPKRGGQ